VRRRCGAALLAFALGAGAPPLLAQGGGPAAAPPPEPLRLTVTLPPASGAGSPVVRASGLLRDNVFPGALRDGFPIRFTFRLELWRASRLWDRLAREVEWFALVQLDPLSGVYTLTRSSGEEEAFSSIEALAQRLAVPFTVDLPPPGDAQGSRFYFVALLAIESLSISELEEVERWLRGDLGRAITREGDVGSALERGARRLLIRFSGLPHRRIEARTPTFTF
jgi:hypothetical protein